MDSDLKQSIDVDKSGQPQNLRVRIINPALENPWRKKGDYDEEQKEARERHAMLQEQHKVILKSQRWTMLASFAAILSAFASCTLVYITYQDVIEQSAAKQISLVTSNEKESENSLPE